MLVVAWSAVVSGAVMPMKSAATGAPPVPASAVDPVSRDEAVKPTTGMRGAPARTRSRLRREVLAKVVIWFIGAIRNDWGCKVERVSWGPPPGYSRNVTAALSGPQNPRGAGRSGRQRPSARTTKNFSLLPDTAG